MDSRFLESKLESHKLFTEIKDSLDTDSNDNSLRNLLELKDDVLYVWNSKDNCLLSLNLKNLEENGSESLHQKLHLLTSPSFRVDHVLAGACGTRICVWGPRGAVVAELPSRWGRAGLFDGGKETVLCKSSALDERFLYSQVEVRRVHWHPSSLSHVLVLVSDNTIRLYNIGLKHGPKLTKVLQIGHRPTGVLAGRRLLDSLGDTAVDFTPVPDTNDLLILRGNGDVYMINCDLSVKSPIPPTLVGPLTMYPPADDNYGVESCSIAIVGGATKPSLVVIATCSNILYHCLLMPEAETRDETLTNSVVESTDYSLYVIEAVELNIVLSTEDDTSLQYSYPVHLYTCPGNSGTYACVHAAGVHTITLPIVTHLKQFMNSDDDSLDAVASCASLGASRVRYVVCTHAKGRFHPPLGLAALPPPLPAALVLCADGTLLNRYIEPYELEEQLYNELQLQNPVLEEDEFNKIMKERQKLSFTAIIQEILAREVSQPILNVNKKEEPNPKEALEFASQATLKLRQEYIVRQQRALDAIKEKITRLRNLKKKQADWFHALKTDIEAAQLQSSVLIEKCALAEKYQDDLKYRCSNVVRLVRGRSAANPAERALLRELHQFNMKAEDDVRRIEDLKRRARDKADELEKWQKEYKKKDIALGKSHSDTISSILQQQTKQISNLIEETKLLKDRLNIV